MRRRYHQVLLGVFHDLVLTCAILCGDMMIRRSKKERETYQYKDVLLTNHEVESL